MLKRGKILCVVVLAIAAVACLVGCAHSATVGNTSNYVQWDNITAAAATADDEASFELTEESDCSACHEAEVESRSDTNCLAGDPAHADLVCTDCHVLDNDLKKVHSGLDADSKPGDELKRTTVANDTCLACHDMNQVIANTPEDAYLVDKNGTKVNPHEVQNLGGSHADTACTSCHVVHKDAVASETAYSYCLSCHHAEVFECGTCH